MAELERKIKWHSSLRTKFIFVPMAIMILLFFIVSSGLIWIARQSLREAEFKTQENKADMIALMISHYIKHSIENLELFERMHNLPGLDNKRQKQVIEDFLIQRKHLFNEIALLDSRGREKVKVSRFRFFSNEELKTRENTDAFKMASQHGRYISDIFISPASGLLSIEIGVSVGNYVDKIYGFLMAELNIKRLWEEVSNIKIGEHGYAYIIDKKGRFIAFQEASTILQRYGENMEKIPPVKQFMEASQDTKRIVYEYKGLKGNDVIGIYAPVDWTQWAVIAELPSSEAFAGIKKMQVYLFIFISFALLFIGIAGFFISRKMVKYIFSFIITAERIGEGDLETPIHEIDREDEIGILARTLSKMQKELKKLYKDLDAQVHHLKKTKDALEENAEKLHMINKRMMEIIEFLPDATFVIDENKKIIAWNKACDDITGIKKADIIGTDEYARPFYGKRRPILIDFVISGNNLSDDELKTYYLSVQKKGSMIYGLSKAQYLSNKGIEFLSEVACPLFGTSGKVTGAIESIRDVTEMKRLEAQVAQSQKMEAIGTLAGGIAHDFNNLLMGIMGFVNLMLHNKDLSKEHQEMLKKIENQAISGAELAKRLLGFARGGMYEVRPTDLNVIIKKTIDTFRRTRKDIVIHDVYEKELWPSEVDRVQIEQVLLNLLINAGEAMPNGGYLYIESNNVEIPEDMSMQNDVKPGRYVKFSVKDTGRGMDNKTMERVFDPFFTTKEMGRGAGLGLASSFGIIKTHGGFIQVESEIGKGSTFTVFLPASDKPVEVDISEQKTLEKGNELILLVDDEEIVLDVTKAMLEALSYRVITAKGGKEAIELFNKKKSDIHLVILDMIMPDMGGEEVFHKLKHINPDIKIILSSGYSIDGKARDILNKGCNGFLQKPFKLDYLSEKIREILSSL